MQGEAEANRASGDVLRPMRAQPHVSESETVIGQ